MPIVEPSGAPGGGSQPIQMGLVSPIGVVTPNLPTQPLYCDSTHGSLYIAVGPTSADWIMLGGVDSSPFTNQPVGVSFFKNNGGIGVIGGGTQGGASGTGGVFMQDQGAALGSDGGIYWTGGADGTQHAQMVTGPGGNLTGQQDEHGTFSAAPGGIKFPTADPHIVGAWWDNAGTLTKSAG